MPEPTRCAECGRELVQGEGEVCHVCDRDLSPEFRAQCDAMQGAPGTLDEALASLTDEQRAEVRAEMDAVMPEIARRLNEPGPLARLLKEPDRIAGATIPPGAEFLYKLPDDAVPGQVWPRTRVGPFTQAARDEAVAAGRAADAADVRRLVEDGRAVMEAKFAKEYQVDGIGLPTEKTAPDPFVPREVRALVPDALDRLMVDVLKHMANPDRLPPEAVAWQRHVCAAWARAIGREDVTAANAPTVIDLQDATAAKRADEHRRGSQVVVRIWAGALGAKLTPGDEVTQLIEATLELVERDAEQQHAITNLTETVAAHRDTIRSLTETPESLKETSPSVNENLAALARKYLAAKALWRATKHPDDAAHYDEMDACLDEMEALVAQEQPPAAPAKPEETDDGMPF